MLTRFRSHTDLPSAAGSWLPDSGLRVTTIGVLAVQGDVREHAKSLSAVGVESVVEIKYEYDLDGIAGLVIPGGESTTIANLLKRQGLLEPIRQRISDGLPVYGSCAGLILLADRVEGGTPDQATLGGLDITVRRNAFGRQVASFEAPVQLAEIVGGPVHGIFIRAPWIAEVGSEVEVLGSVRDHSGVERVVAVRQGSLMATSFHPELTDDERIHKYFVESVVPN